MKKSNTETFGYYLNKYLTVYLPGTRGLATNSIISYRDTFSLLIVFLKSEKESQDGIVIIPKLALNVIIYLIGGISGVLLMRLFCAAEHFSTSLRSDQSDPCL